MATDNSSNNPEWWSWEDILRRTDRLGIPNFQRGAVWDAGNRAALLESIYEKSPCGSFVFWEPDDSGDPWRHGVPLCSFGSDDPLWLVDGQQRTRTMLDTFAQLLDPHRKRHAPPLVREADLTSLENVLRPGHPLPVDAEDYEPEAGDGSLDDGRKTDAALWMVVLPAMREFDSGSAPFFGPYTESRSVRRGSIFRCLQPLPRMRINSQEKLRPVPPIPAGSIPLAALIAPSAVFRDAELRRDAIAALRSLRSGGDDFARLDDLLPWGPQFVTGHAYETPSSNDAPSVVMTWTDIGRRRAEVQVAEQVKRLEDLLGEGWSPVFERFADMLNGSRFAVGWLPPSDISAAIDAYVRINRAGIRVRAEEQALALLSRARPKLLDDLAEFSRRRDGGFGTADGRALLAHESERHMGFPLWMATVTRFAALLLLGDAARAWLRTSAIDKDTFSYRLDRVGPQETSKGKATWARTFENPGVLIGDAVEQASAALLLIDDILSQELHLDHRMARSQTVALTPLLDLLSRVPAGEIDDLAKNGTFRAAMARVLHCLLLHPGIDQADMESLVLAAHGIREDVALAEPSPLPLFGSDSPGDREHVHEAIRQSLHRLVGRLAEVWSRHYSRSETPTNLSDPLASLSQFAADSFEKDVRDARSLQHRAVGWLYAIERRNCAREFSWRAQMDGNRENQQTGIPGLAVQIPHEEFLRRPDIADGTGELYPEKQHVVPFSIATRIVGKGGGRATASPSNAIGNLTWLSRRQNSLEALSDNWTVMDLGIDRENLEARGMLAPVTIAGHSATVLDTYLELSRGLAYGEEPLTSRREHWQSLYDTICKGRSEWMIGQMREWLERPLESAVLGWLKDDVG